MLQHEFKLHINATRNYQHDSNSIQNVIVMFVLLSIELPSNDVMYR